MKTARTISLFFAAAFFFTACNTSQPPQVADNPPPASPATDQPDDYVMNDFDLQRVGNLLERSNSPEEFETYLNEPNGLNNLDLNGDGYVDYISVDEFGDR